MISLSEMSTRKQRHLWKFKIKICKNKKICENFKFNSWISFCSLTKSKSFYLICTLLFKSHKLLLVFNSSNLLQFKSIYCSKNLTKLFCFCSRKYRFLILLKQSNKVCFGFENYILKQHCLLKNLPLKTFLFWIIINLSFRLSTT